MEKPTALIIGGSSGLGLELGHLLSATHQVFVTGRRNPKQSHLEFIRFELDDYDEKLLDTSLEGRVSALIGIGSVLEHVDLFIYAAGFLQEGRIYDVPLQNFDKMIRVGLLAPALLIQRVLFYQDHLPGFIAITSTSQWTPRPLEPMYTAVKAGLGMFANSLALDPKVGKTLVAGPAGMATRFWENNPRDTSKMLDPKWVAEQIMQLYADNFKYKFARIMRDPPRVEVVETR